MTDEIPKDVTPKDFPGPEDPDGLTMADVQPKDGFLDFLLSVMTGRKDELDGSFGITLTVGGAVVSGMAIGRKEWIRLYIDSVREAGPGDFAEVLEQFFPRMQSQLEEEWDRRDAQNLFGRKRSFIHLKDARVYNGHVHEVGLWRGALADVDGWSMGSHCNDVA